MSPCPPTATLVSRLARFGLALGLCLGLTTGLGCKNNQRPEVSPMTGVQPLVIQRQFTGNDAGLTQPDVMLVNSAEELETKGSEDLRSKEIDFSEHSLIVVTMGQRNTGGFWAHIESAQLVGDQLFVQGSVNKPAADAMVTQQITYPYAAAVIPKVAEDVTVVPELDQLQGADLQEAMEGPTGTGLEAMPENPATTQPSDQG